MNLLKFCINKKVVVEYIEKGEKKSITAKLKNFDDRAVTLISGNINYRLGFIAEFSAITVIRYMNIPVYKNDYVPPRYGYNPLHYTHNTNEKNKIYMKKFGKKDK